MGPSSRWGQKPPKQLKVHQRPKWQNKTDVPRIGGRRALNAASAARYERLEEKTDRAGGFFAGLVLLWQRIKERFFTRHHKPQRSKPVYKVEVK